MSGKPDAVALHRNKTAFSQEQEFNTGAETLCTEAPIPLTVQ